jgi:hypothetical protein
LRSLQTILFNFGIISKVEKKISYQLSIHPLSLARFYSDIGFGLERKQAHRSLLIPPYDDTNPHITTDSLGNHYHTVLIDKILPSHAEVYDFVIPDTHSFFSNGLISHNTPRGKNHLWDLYQIAKQSPLWFCYKQTVEDTKHISLEAIEQERLEGIMSEDLIQQEYYTSFTMGIEGAYYLKYFDKLRLNNQIGNVAWEPSFPVNTSWDLGVRDSTAIIFYQVVGQAIHVIDCYENTKEGLEHYIKVLKEKPYQYGKHTAPHDIRVREFSSGITRLDKARHLGINFIIAPNIPVMDGIEQVRTILPRCWFDQTKCAQLIKSLENYRQEYDNKRKVYHNQPLHDQWSNFADSMRYLALTLPKTKDTTSAQELEQRYRSAMYGEENLPDFFR